MPSSGLLPPPSSGGGGGEGSGEVVTSAIKPFSSAETYERYDLIRHHKRIYSCNAISIDPDSPINLSQWAELSQGIAPFSTASPYTINDLIVYRDRLFRCTASNVPAGQFLPSNWFEMGTQVSIQPYVQSRVYEAGEVIFKNTNIYRCTIQTTGTFNEDRWQGLSPPVRPNSLEQYDSTVEYLDKETCRRGNDIYQCIFPPSLGNWSTNQAKWERILEVRPLSLASFSGTTIYLEGETMTKDGKLYRCTAESTVGTWLSTHTNWSEIREIKNRNLDPHNVDTVYSSPDTAMYDGRLYRRTAPISSGAFSLDEWSEIPLGGKRSLDVYSILLEYEVSDTVMFEGKLYRCITVPASVGEFTPDDWVEIPLEGEEVVPTVIINTELFRYAQYRRADASTYIKDLQTNLTIEEGAWASRTDLNYI